MHQLQLATTFLEFLFFLFIRTLPLHRHPTSRTYRHPATFYCTVQSTSRVHHSCGRFLRERDLGPDYTLSLPYSAALAAYGSLQKACAMVRVDFPQNKVWDVISCTRASVHRNIKHPIHHIHPFIPRTQLNATEPLLSSSLKTKKPFSKPTNAQTLPTPSFSSPP